MKDVLNVFEEEITDYYYACVNAKITVVLVRSPTGYIVSCYGQETRKLVWPHDHGVSISYLTQKSISKILFGPFFTAR